MSEDFERDHFIAYRHETGAICMQDSPNGWRIAIEAKDIPAFIEWLTHPPGVVHE